MNADDVFTKCRHGCNCQQKVARIGRRDYAKEAYPPSIWREVVRSIAQWLLCSLLGVLFLGGIFLFVVK